MQSLSPTLAWHDARTYIYALAFTLAGIALPALCHLIPHGGLSLLPIYFFTLIAAYRFGWRTGLLTAMPPAAMLPAILTKSLLLAAFAALVAARSRRPLWLGLVVVVAAYQLAGSLLEWAYTGSLAAALQDVRLGLPGILLQIGGGWLVLRKWGAM